MTDVVALAAELLAIQSSTGAKSHVVDFVSRWLIARGWNVDAAGSHQGARQRLGVRGQGGGVTLSTHLDTVPPYIAPRSRTTRLYGRGACDAKGIAAAMLCRRRPPGRRRASIASTCCFVVGEEKGLGRCARRQPPAGDEQVPRQRRAHREQAGERREGIAARHRAHPRTRRALRVSAPRRVRDRADARAAAHDRQARAADRR